MSKTACIVLNYRGTESALRLIDSLEKSSWTDRRIFVVENGSNDGSAEIFAQRIGHENLIVAPENLGYAGGMNLGLRAALDAGCDFFWILTKDLTVEADALSHLHSLWPKLDKPGMLGSLTDLNGTDRVYFFRSKIDRHGRSRHGNKGRSIGDFSELREEFGHTDYVNGACVFTHRSVIQKVGLIPEEYFLYFEDCAWGLSALRQGFRNYVSYRSRVHHHREVGAFNRTAEYYSRRNSFLFRKNFGFTKPWSKALELLRLKKTALKFWMRRDHKMVEIILDVIRDVRADASGLKLPYR